MWLKALLVLAVAVLAGASVLLLSSGGSHSRRSSLTVTPASGGPATAFVFSFRAPDPTGRVGDSRLGYVVSVSGPLQQGCLAAREDAVSRAGRDQEASVRLDPARLGGDWCPGLFTARALEVQTSVCSAGAMCPQNIRVVRTVAHATFRVIAS